MTILEAVLAEAIFAHRNQKWQRLDPVGSRRGLLRLCVLLPILAGVVGVLEIAGAVPQPLTAAASTLSASAP